MPDGATGLARFLIEVLYQAIGTIDSHYQADASRLRSWELRHASGSTPVRRILYPRRLEVKGGKND